MPQMPQPTPFSRVQQPGQAHKPGHIHQGGQNSQNSTPDSVNMFHLSFHLSAYPAFSYMQTFHIILCPVSEGDIEVQVRPAAGLRYPHAKPHPKWMHSLPLTGDAGPWWVPPLFMDCLVSGLCHHLTQHSSVFTSSIFSG